MKNPHYLEGQELKDQLNELGLPQHIVEDLSAREKELRKVNLTGGITVVVALILSIFALVLAFLLWAMPAIDARLLVRAEASNAILYGNYFGPSVVLALFLLFFFAGWVSTHVTVMWKWSRDWTAFAALARSDAKEMMSRLELTISATTTVDQIARAVNARYRRMFLAGLVVLGTLTPAVFAREWNTGEFFYADAYKGEPLLPWESDHIVPFSDVVAVEVGCRRTKGRSADSHLVYRMVLESGRTLSPIDKEPVGKSWLEAMGEIDAALVAQGTPFERRMFRGERQLHPRCLRDMEQRYEAAELQRVHHLIRYRTGDFDEPSSAGSTSGGF